jgi:malonate transporter
MLPTTLSVLLPLFFVMGLGYFAGRTQRIDSHQRHGIQRVLVEFALPAALFVGTAQTPRAELVQMAPLLAALLLVFAAVWLSAQILARLLFAHEAGTAALQATTVAFPNTGFIGVPILGGLFGASSIPLVGMATGMGTLLFIPITVIVLELTRHRSAHAPQSTWRGVVIPAFWNAIRAPLVWAPLAAAALALFEIAVPRDILNVLHFLGSITAGLAMFAVGLTLAAYPLRADFETAGNAFLKMILQPLLLFLLAPLLGISAPLAQQGVILCTLPSGILATVLAARYETYQAEASSTLVLTSLLLLALLPAWRIVLG